jgi:uncharacterized membrane protein YjgN (DUF898 family)
VLLHRSGNLNLCNNYLWGKLKGRVYVNNTHFFATERRFLNRNCQYFRTTAVSCVEKYFKKLLWERLMICPALQKILDAQKKCYHVKNTFLLITMNGQKSLIIVQFDIMLIIIMSWSNFCPLKFQE